MECTWLKTNNKEYDKGHVFGLPSNEDYYQNGGLDVLIEEVLQNICICLEGSFCEKNP